MKPATIFTALMALAVAVPASAANPHYAIRPSETRPQTTIDPIDGYVRTTYPPEFKSVREAVTWLLEETGWVLQTTADIAPADANAILSRPIDPIAQLPRTMSRLTAMQVLIGTDNAIVLDREHRLVSFTALGGRQ